MMAAAAVAGGPSSPPFQLKAAYAVRGARRMRRMAEHFRALGRPCGSVAGLMLVVGEEGGKPGAVPIQAYIQRWLFGDAPQIISNTAVILTPHGAVIITSRSKAAYLAPLKDEVDHLQQRATQKAAAADAAFSFRLHFEKRDSPDPAAGYTDALLRRSVTTLQLTAAARTIGILEVPAPPPPFFLVLLQALKSRDLAVIDTTDTWYEALSACQDGEPSRCAQAAARSLAQAMGAVYSRLTELASLRLTDAPSVSALEREVKACLDQCIASKHEGVIYCSLRGASKCGIKPRDRSKKAKAGEEAKAGKLHDAVILAAATHHRGYCAEVARTMLLQPSANQRWVYTNLLRLRESVLALIQDGMRAADIAACAVDRMTNLAAELLPHLVHGVGRAMDMHLRQELLAMRPDCSAHLRGGAVVALELGLANVPHSLGPSPLPAGDPRQNQTYTLYLVDTLIIDGLGAKSAARPVTTPTGPGAQPDAWMLPSHWAAPPSPARVTPARATPAAGACANTSPESAASVAHVPAASSVLSSNGRLLPHDVLVKIFAHLDAVSLAHASRVCRHWSRVPWTTLDLGSAKHALRLIIPRKVVVTVPAMGRPNHVRYVTKVEEKGGRPVNFLRLLRTPRCMQLQRLSLSGLELLTDSLDVLQCLERLQELDISLATFKPRAEVGRRLGSLLAQPRCKLQRLFARDAFLSDEDIRAIAKGLAQNTSLEILDIERSLIGSPGLRALETALCSENNTLKELNIGRIAITAEGLYFLPGSYVHPEVISGYVKNMNEAGRSHLVVWRNTKLTARDW